MILALILITVTYLILISVLIYGFGKVEDFALPDLNPKTKFSVLIPFRNEESHLPLLLTSISKLNYPRNLFEILFIDDESTDNSVQTIESFFKNKNISFKILRNKRTSGSPKKDAITLGIEESINNWIVTTDADCILPKYWLDAYDAHIQQDNSQLLVAPVEIYNNSSFLDRFQALDFLGLQASTIGGFGINRPFLCNGANICYSKELFKNLNGFAGNDTIASGDDIFLLQKAVKDKSINISFIKSEHCTVQTSSQPDRNSLIEQRVRWASKTKRYNSGFAKFVGLVVLFMNASLLGGLVFMIFGILPPKILFYSFIIKISIDFLLIFKAARFFNRENLMLSYVLSCLVYPLFVLFISIISIFGKYKWKGRRFKT